MSLKDEALDQLKAGGDTEKAYVYATLAMADALEEIANELHDATRALNWIGDCIDTEGEK